MSNPYGIRVHKGEEESILFKGFKEFFGLGVRYPYSLSTPLTNAVYLNS
jgi:hypothetical protein